MKRQQLVQHSWVGGAMMTAILMLLYQDLWYGSAEAYCTNLEGRWLDSMWAPLWAAVAIGLCLFYGWLLHKASAKENVAEVIFTLGEENYETTHDVVIPKGTRLTKK